MHIAGLQKMTLLDYPGKVACTVFLSGCNYRCPFCHNGGLLENAPEALTEEELLTFLEKRKGLLDGVCITGGEPTLQPDLPHLLESVKALGYSVKLDTNGSNPAMLAALLEKGLVDYVAMDVKNSPERYGETVGIPGIPLEKTEQSLRLLLAGPTDYELRTTCVAEFHEEEAAAAMGAWVESLVLGVKPAKWYLQCFVDRDSVLLNGLHAPNREKLEKMRKALEPHALSVSLRGVD